VDENRFSLAHRSAFPERVGGGSIGSGCRRTNAIASLTHRAFKACAAW